MADDENSAFAVRILTQTLCTRHGMTLCVKSGLLDRIYSQKSSLGAGWSGSRESNPRLGLTRNRLRLLRGRTCRRRFRPSSRGSGMPLATKVGTPRTAKRRALRCSCKTASLSLRIIQAFLRALQPGIRLLRMAKVISGRRGSAT
jgi:hypothetical protein